MKFEIKIISVILLGALFASAAIASEDFKPFFAVLSENATVE